jgi:hypothetical protein
MTDAQATLSVTVDGKDEATTQGLVALLTPYQAGKIVKTRDFGVTLALAASIVALAKGVIELWEEYKKAKGLPEGNAKPPGDAKPLTAVTIEARDGSVLSLAEVHDQEEILTFIRNHAK